jgi:hypothetical protein
VNRITDNVRIYISFGENYRRETGFKNSFTFLFSILLFHRLHRAIRGLTVAPAGNILPFCK